MSDFWDFLGIVVYVIVAIIVRSRSRSDAEEAAHPPPVVLTPVDDLRIGFRPDGAWHGDVSQDEYDYDDLRRDLDRMI